MVQVAAAEPARTSIMSPSLGAFAELRRGGVFDKALPRSVNSMNWLDAPVSVLKGVGAASAAVLVSKRIKTVRDVAMTRAMFEREVPTAGKALGTARVAIREAAQKYGLQLTPQLPDGPPITTMAYFVDPVTGRGYSR